MRRVVDGDVVINRESEADALLCEHMTESDLVPIDAQRNKCIDQCSVGIDKRSVEVTNGNFALGYRRHPSPPPADHVMSVVSSRDETDRHRAIR